MTVAFLHLPKTAGSTLSSYLEQALPALHRINDPDQLRSFLYLSQGERDALQIVMGHMPYGVHRYLTVECRYVVFLRDPVERVISAYYHVQRIPEHPLHAAIKGGMTLAEFAHAALANDNAQTRRLGRYVMAEALLTDTYWWLTVPNGGVGEAHLAQALGTLAACDFVGFTETFDADALRLFSRLGLEAPAVAARLNETIGRPVLADIDPQTRAAIREANQYDIRLYAEACDRYGPRSSGSAPCLKS